MFDFNIPAALRNPLTYVATVIIASLFYLGTAVSENSRKLDLVLAEVRENGSRLEAIGARIDAAHEKIDRAHPEADSP